MGKRERRSLYNKHRSKRPKKFKRDAVTCECTSKDGHPKSLFSKYERATRHGLKFGVRFRVYRCDEGKGWHITTRLASWIRERDSLDKTDRPKYRTRSQ